METTKNIKINSPETLTNCLYNLIVKSRRIQPLGEKLGWGIGDVIAQATQEIGEFSEQAMINDGKIPHKVPEYDGVFYEGADVIICLVDVIAKQYPNESPAQILSKLAHAVNRKSDKWEAKTEKEMLDKFQESVTIVS